MDCVICNSVASGVQVIFSLVVYLLIMVVNLVVVMIDWLLQFLTKKKSPSS